MAVNQIVTKYKACEIQSRLRMKAVRPYLLHAILILCINLCCCIAVFGSRNETDRLALIAFKDGITQDPLRRLSSWNDSVHFCHWSGVSCSRRHAHRVTELNVSSYELVGFLSPHIGNLTFLRKIVLRNNSFHGEVPPQIGRLFRLRFLDFRNNSFQGKVPANLTHCLDLRILNLNYNKIEGKILVGFGLLPKLRFLGLSANYFTGSIPESLGNLSSLAVLSLGQNSLEGNIPIEIGRATRIEFLQLSLNKLSGTIPSSIYNLSALYYFQVMYNQLEGSIPQDIGLTLPRLTDLAFAVNRFTGRVPVSLSNASMLQVIHFPGNSFTGPVPPDLGRLQNLRSINFDSNQLGSTEEDDLSFIPALANCTRLENLVFGNNFLKGSSVGSIANLSSRIYSILLGGNQIHGTIPLGIENLVNLTILDISGNHLTGTIPGNIGKLHKLQLLSLDGNKLLGRIPASLGNLTLLNYLYLNNNNLYGEIPPSLAACQNLLGLALSTNKLNGSIPKELIGLSSLTVFLQLSGNSLNGSLPLEVGNLINLGMLDLSNNRLSGVLPNTLGDCVKMQSLRVGGNFLIGEIPTSLWSLRGLEDLDLSVNKFSGQIPAFLGEFPFLTNLNLSFNDFDGEVPRLGVFGNATRVSVVGNYNICGGIPELNLPVCFISSSKQKGKHLVVKVVIPVVVVVSCLILLAFFFIIRQWRRKSRLDGLSMQLFNNTFQRISYWDLHKATEGFSESNMIGIGSYSAVYMGILDRDEMTVAVKVLNLLQRGASKSFMSECKALKNIRHRNLVKIFSVCSSIDLQGNDFKALVFEFMPQGSLERWLHPEVEDDEPKKLNLLQRLNIGLNVASALEYLHSGCESIVIHGDLKPSNVLLDNDMTAHVSDFGLAKIISIVSSATSAHTNQSSSIAVKGSIGYIAPEYGVNGYVSTEGDVYSYGILLLEMFTGRRPTDDMFQDGLTLHDFVKTSLPERVIEVIDPALLLAAGGRGHEMEECMVSVMAIGVTCSNESPRDRMEMGDVVKKLHSIKNLLTEAIHDEGRKRADNEGEGTS